MPMSCVKIKLNGENDSSCVFFTANTIAEIIANNFSFDFAHFLFFLCSLPLVLNSRQIGFKVLWQFRKKSLFILKSIEWNGEKLSIRNSYMIAKKGEKRNEQININWKDLIYLYFCDSLLSSLRKKFKDWTLFGLVEFDIAFLYWYFLLFGKISSVKNLVELFICSMCEKNL